MTAGDRAAPNGAAPIQPKRYPEQFVREARWGWKLARARAHVAVVVVYHSGGHQVIWPHERTRVHLHRRPATVYEVDLGIHHARVEEDLPSQGHSGSFHAKITVDWRVLDPSAVVRHQVLDIRNSLDITTPTGMQQAMQKAIKAGCLGAKYGLWTSAITHLTLDEAATEHNAKMMKLKWALEEEEAEHELQRMKNQNAQEITAKRIAVYREIIASGDIEQFALRLANHPGEISAVTEIIREDQLTRRQDTIDFIKHMVDSGVVERWEVGDQVREALEWLRDATARVVTDNHQRAAETDPPGRQRRRGRSDPTEQSAESGQSPDVIVIPAEAVSTEQDTDSGSSADTDI